MANTYIVSSGQVASNTLNYGDVETVLSGGKTANQHNGGQRFVASGAVVNNGEVSSGGKDYISSGGSSFQGYIDAGGIRSGYGGAIITQPYVGSGGSVLLDSGAILNSTYVSGVVAGGLISAASGALLTGDIAVRGGTISGGTLISGAKEVVSSGGKVANQTITSGASATLLGYINSTTSNVTLDGGTLDLQTGRLGTVGVTGSNGTLILNSAGAVTLSKGDTFSNGNKAIVNTSGTLNSGVVGHGGLIQLNGGTVSNTFVSSGGTLDLVKGTTVNTSILTGGHVIVESGFTLDVSSMLVKTISSATVIDVKSGGKAQNNNIQSGGLVNVESGGLLGGTTNVSSGATLSAGVVNSGATVNVSSGGTFDGLETVARGGTLNVNSSYVYSSVLAVSGTANRGIISGAGVTVASGGVVSALAIDSGGSLVIGNAAKTVDTSINGGTLELQSGSVTTNTSFGKTPGGTLLIGSGKTFSGGDNASYTVGVGDKIVVQSGGGIQNFRVGSGGTTIISSGGQLVGTQVVSSGGTLVLNGTAGSGAVNLVGNGAQVTISGTQMPTNTISGWSPTDKIDLASISKSSILKVTTTAQGVTFQTTHGNYQLNVPGANKYGYELLDDGKGDTIYTTCFAEGTLIATPGGQVAVEALMQGDLVSTPKGAMPVKWMGHRAIEVQAMRVPEENWLVRIEADALADGVPARDLLVTQEHCMVFEGKLVPARMLVNGRSVRLDRSIASYTYYHVELDTHEALWAEGALTESYLDTGNRDQFSNNVVTAVSPERVAAGSEGLPLDTSRGFVEPIYTAIVARADAAETGYVETAIDAGLHLVTETGAVIHALRVRGEQHIFRLPEGVATVALVSRSARPSDAIGPFVDDRRELGVLVGGVRLFSATGTQEIEAPFQDAALPGWNGLEASHLRWTNGAGVLPLTEASEPRVLSVQVVATGTYRTPVMKAAVA